jgi:UDP-N-acetylglucosamine 4,6-dehydratase
MISEDDARRTFAFDNYYVITPVLAQWQGPPIEGGKNLPDGFAYRSDTNDLWLGADELHELLRDL